MRKFAFPCVAILAIGAVAAAQLDVAPEYRDPTPTPDIVLREVPTEVLRQQYLELQQLKVQRLTDEELRLEVLELQQLRAEAEFDEIIEELKGVAERHPQTLAAGKAGLAVHLLQTRDGTKLQEVKRVLEQQQTAEETVPQYPSFYFGTTR